VVSGSPLVIAAGLGPAGPEMVPVEVDRLLRSGVPAWLRTKKHPAAEAYDLPSFDYLYEEASSFEEVYQNMADRVVELAGQAGRVVLALPGSPLVGEAVVSLLRKRPEVSVEFRLAPSFLDLAWQKLDVDPLRQAVTVVDATDFRVEAAGRAGPFLVAQAWSKELLSEVKLAVEEPPSQGAIILHHLGLADEAILEVTWEDLDRALLPDHLTSVWIPSLAAPVAAEVERLVAIARELRERCPWDRSQDHHSLIPHLREEAYELMDAIWAWRDESGDLSLIEELGDVLYQVVFHCQIAAESGRFDLSDVAREVREKLWRRHPHVFGEATAEDEGAALRTWEEMKAKEKKNALGGLPTDLPALALAQSLQRRISSRSLPTEAISGLDEASAKVALGLWEEVQRASAEGVDAEEALRRLVLCAREVLVSERRGTDA
jgi:tetrapyrrole methylase family protein/MazG family protein